MKIRDIDVVILCGGLGARLHSITKDKVQKCMVDVNGKPFLEILVSDLKAQGFEKFILCAGHKNESIFDYFIGNKTAIKAKKFITNCESKQSGTAGAIKSAETNINSEYFIVMNGDTYLHIHFEKLIKYFFLQKKDNSLITKYIDSISGEHVGLYIFHKKVLDFIKENSKLSLEENILPHMKVKEIVGPIPFIDIGTPEGYKEINNLFI